MSLLLDKLLFGKEDFVNFRDFSQNLSEGKVNIFIREAQTMEVRAFLGRSLWNRLTTDYDEDTKTFTDPALDALWFGTVYVNPKGETITYNGYMAAAIYWAYARMLAQNQVNVSRFGVESVQNEISEDVSNAQIRIKNRDAEGIALQYQQDALTYLKDNASTYPEYKQAETNPKNNTFPFYKLK